MALLLTSFEFHTLYILLKTNDERFFVHFVLAANISCRPTTKTLKALNFSATKKTRRQKKKRKSYQYIYKLDTHIRD